MKIARTLITLLAAWTPLLAQINFSVSTDKAVYQYGDSIHITITAINPTGAFDTLDFSSTCQVDYYIDNFNLLSQRSCGNIVTYRVIPPHDTVTWGAPDLPAYPVTPETLGTGRHAVVGKVLGYWTSDTLWITVSGVSGVKQSMIMRRDYFLAQNYPNPFNPTTVINYDLPVGGEVTLKVFNVLGQTVATLVNGYEPPGSKSVTFDASNLPSGVYFYRVTSGAFTDVKKLVVMR
jgi:hypothetical protein